MQRIIKASAKPDLFYKTLRPSIYIESILFGIKLNILEIYSQLTSMCFNVILYDMINNYI